MSRVTVHTHPNIALIKYWGKRDENLMLPTKSSFSIAIAPFKTITTITTGTQNHDTIEVGWKGDQQKAIMQIAKFLDIFRQKYGISHFFNINTRNSFATNAGLASSASGYAALALGLNKICALNLSKQELSILARMGSGSACRSIYGGFARWNGGTKTDGTDSYARQEFSPTHWPELRIIIALVSAEEKKISSREGMQRSAQTSPLYNHWVKTSQARIPEIMHAVKNRDLTRMGVLMEADWYGMLSTMITSVPPLDYRTQATHDVISMVKEMREKENLNTYFTTDAGPNVKVICLEHDVNRINQRLKTVPGVQETIVCTVAPDPVIIAE